MMHGEMLTCMVTIRKLAPPPTRFKMLKLTPVHNGSGFLNKVFFNIYYQHL